MAILVCSHLDENFGSHLVLIDGSICSAGSIKVLVSTTIEVGDLVVVAIRASRVHWPLAELTYAVARYQEKFCST